MSVCQSVCDIGDGFSALFGDGRGARTREDAQRPPSFREPAPQMLHLDSPVRSERWTLHCTERSAEDEPDVTLVVSVGPQIVAQVALPASRWLAKLSRSCGEPVLELEPLPGRILRADACAQAHAFAAAHLHRHVSGQC